MHRRRFLSVVGALGIGSMAAGCGRSEAPGAAQSAPGAVPAVIRLAPHGTWGSKIAQGIMGVVQTRRYLEEEFEPDGVRIEWNPMDGGGIGINEAIANDQVDASLFGIFPQIVGRARGNRTRIIASNGYNYQYLAVRSALPATSPGQLKGATLAISFGANTHHAMAMLLRTHGLSLRDVKLVNMDVKEANAAIAAGKIDGLVGGPQVFALEDQGFVRVIYATAGRNTFASSFGGLFVTERFHSRYPDATRRLLNSYLRATHWVSLPENRSAFFDFAAANSTVPRGYLERDFKDRDLKEAFNPLMDPYYIARVRDVATFCVDNKIIKQAIDIDSWLDQDLIGRVIADLGLDDYWASWSPAGSAAPAAQLS